MESGFVVVTPSVKVDDDALRRSMVWILVVVCV